MKILNIEQGSAEWHEARMGIPTASRFKEIMTGKLKPSASSSKYMHELLAEWVLGEPASTYVSEFMDRGIELEPKAVKYYEFEKDVKTEQAGFCLMDNGLVGCSPDRLINPGGGLEIKCPMAKTHIKYLLGGSVEGDYLAQVQGSLYVTDRAWWDVLSYNPMMPPALVRVHRDEAYIQALDSIMNGFLERLELAKDKLKALGITGFMEQRLAEEAEVNEAFNEVFGNEECTMSPKCPCEDCQKENVKMD